ncbi:PREDICTED: receptor-like protein 55 [Nelumbo nucifera]|uniref:Receptor-like protein 55 n=1 Tax=Nelumbo nucifera TaxID=4432 RepID=A0A1U8AYS1_NELNU|nr:PREDICTED: receptor-like protein 55 [Nelumbo nucifera]
MTLPTTAHFKASQFLNSWVLDISSSVFHPYLLLLPTVKFTQRLADIEWISGLRFLRHLALNGVDLSLVGSKWIQLPNMLLSLTELHLSRCSLSAGVIPSLHHQSVVNFTSLAVIDLSFNNINSNILDWILNVSSLVHVDMSDNRLHGRIPLGISELPNLKYLDLSVNENLSASCSQTIQGKLEKN